MRARVWILAIVTVVVVAAIAIVVVTGGDDAPASDTAAEENAMREPPRRVAQTGSGGAAESPRSSRRGAESSSSGEGAPESRSARIDRERWSSIVTKLREAREREEREGAAAGPAAMAEPRGSLDREYIREAVRAVTPLLAECYELAREEDPTLEGRLIVEFTIGGDPEVGGVVEQSAVAEDSALRHPVLDECVRETMYTIELPPPEEGGRVDVRYPFVFSPDEEEETSETR
jgi:hypothetical protein